MNEDISHALHNSRNRNALSCALLAPAAGASAEILRYAQDDKRNDPKREAPLVSF